MGGKRRIPAQRGSFFVAVLQNPVANRPTTCATLCIWLEYGEVNVSNFPKGFPNAIISQEGIGWRHYFFAGKISQEWLQLQEDSTNKTIGLKRDCYVWGSNEEVHGKSVEQQKRIRKTIKLSTDVRKLNGLKDKARPVDMGLFHNNIEEFIDKSTAQTIATFIRSHRRAIAKTVKKYEAASQAGESSVVQRIQGWSNNNLMQ
ncbi:hypothetical protein FRACYDRAFT_235569 [Fragilariopsis cylindrus CCMP1102]|uniref:Uncharacterized protein n=1 Tax=Fragilariopsis cylindrus CCMP1102 TaxID=635003 RepID=A0A1E7FMV8_9STRA|nr:hypothetical protein FRACYDRAFT_235569 [Fragilariopsis cylindrus CCMP1102]|eukprot:OEU19512.1 hypothetical protein FRACYDRAFT_235569 [Fragilariopsis cylindrus CCMP1102]